MGIALWQLTLKRHYRDGALIVNVGIDGRRGPSWSAAWSWSVQVGLSRKPRWQRRSVGDNQPATNWASDQHWTDCHRSVFANNCLIEVGSRQVVREVWAGCCSPTMNDFNQILPTSKEAATASCRLYSSQPRGVARELSQEWRGGAWMHIGWQRDAVKYWDLDGRHKLLRPQTKSDLFHWRPILDYGTLGARDAW